MTKKIIHIDMDAFYASVEQRDNPTLRGKPIIVGGSPQERSVVSTASYEARKYKIRSAMPVKTAIKLCPNLIIVEPNFTKYKAVSKQIHRIFEDYTTEIEPVSLDECYLDVTNNKKNIKYASTIAKEIRQRIKSELNLTASAGVAPNKLLAKVASDINKPDGICIITPDKVSSFIYSLPVEKIWGVGKKTYAKLETLGVRTCGDLQRLSMMELLQQLGTFGKDLYYYCRGIDDAPVISHWEAKSIGSETTLQFDTDEINVITTALQAETNTAYERLKKQNKSCKTITIKIKFDDFSQITRSKTINYYTDDLSEIISIENQLLAKINLNNKKIRLIGMAMSTLVDNSQLQDLFS